MNIVLIGMGFYQYEKEIKTALEDMGNSVVMVVDAPKHIVAHNAVIRKRIRDNLIERHQRRVLEKLRGIQFDCVITIVGRHLSRDFLKNLRKDHPHAKCILYLWDDVQRVQNYEEVKDLYDSILSFDLDDCRTNGFTFLPLFYLDEYRHIKSVDSNNKIFSAFAMHSDRMEVVRKILKTTGTSANIIVIAGIRRWFKWIVSSAERKGDKDLGIHVKITNLSQEQILCELSGASIVLDIQHPSQRGLTMRTFEALAADKKLITTNERIKEYDFYNPNNIAIVDRDNPILPKDFLESRYEPMSRTFLEKYSLKQWTKTILHKVS